MTSADRAVLLQRHHAVALVSSARWMQQCVREGQLGANVDERRTAAAELQEAIDAITSQLEGTPRSVHAATWKGYAVAMAAIGGATALIAACYLLGSPRTVVGLYIPVVVATAVFIGYWPAMLACGVAFVLNDVLFVHPWQFSPSAEQITAASVVALSCAVLHVLTRMRVQWARRQSFG